MGTHRPTARFRTGDTGGSRHRLVIDSVPGGIVASCICGQKYRPPGSSDDRWYASDRDKVRKLHQEHVTFAR